MDMLEVEDKNILRLSGRFFVRSLLVRSLIRDMEKENLFATCGFIGGIFLQPGKLLSLLFFILFLSLYLMLYVCYTLYNF